MRDALTSAALRRVGADLALKLAPPVPAAVLGELSAGPKAAQRRDVKVAIFEAYERFRASLGYTDRKAWPVFAAFYIHAVAAVKMTLAVDGPEAISKLPKWVFEAHPKMSAATIRRICEHIRKGQVARLAGAYRNRAGSGVLDRGAAGEIKTAILAMITMQPHLSIETLRTQIVARFGIEVEWATNQGELTKRAPLPGLRQFQRYVDRLKEDHAGLILRETNPDAWKGRNRFAFGTQPTGKGLNDIWLIDASPADILLLDGRHSVYVLLDLWSRRMMVLVTKTPRAEAVVALLRAAILAWGVPNEVRTDNGSDFLAMRVRGVLRMLKIEHDVARAYTPEDKAHVERAIGTLQHNLMPQLPGFIGHNVTDRTAIENRKSFAARLGETPEETFCVELDQARLQGRINDWVEIYYDRDEHGGLNGLSPFAQAASYTGTVRRVESERALDMLLMELPGGEGFRKVSKKGIRLENASFWGPGLEVGHKVRVRLDPVDMGRVYVYTADDDAFVCVAENPERLGIDRAKMAARAKAVQAEKIKLERAALRRSKAGFKKDLLEATLDAARERMAPVVAFPRPTETYTTPALAAAADAAGEAPAPAPVVAVQPLAPAQIISLGRSPTAIDAEQDAKHRRYAEWKALSARIAAGEELNEGDARWHLRYGRDAECRALVLIERLEAEGKVTGSRSA
ncbi:Mu transposase C-terminal domain-containing protein [Oleomonas cavernae]|uniref:Mu transposase C-terminal domain-containing protein n=1 Tax=Oleomonas cavernae TaxID=2320859 RepID=UPI001313E8FD|nr:Mu transposase C-terminal domain-containing protein [Oleomonas cavernae]